MLQNQDPEIQAKLLAMQKQYTSSSPAIAMSAKSALHQLVSAQSKDRTVQQSLQQQALRQQQAQARAVETMRAKMRLLTPEQKEEQSRSVDMVDGKWGKTKLSFNFSAEV